VSESKARDRIKKNPKDAEAYRELSTALQNKGDLKGAIAALQQFTTLRPRNTDALTELASLYSSQGARLQPQITAAQNEAQQASSLSAFNSGVTIGGHQVIGPDPIFQALSSLPNTRLSDLYRKQQTSYSQAETIDKRIVKLTPSDATSQLTLGDAARAAGDTQTAIAAYRKFIKLAPDDPSVGQVRAVIKSLQQSSTSPSVTQAG
jgi:cytochrome c-type biogenesis protein CcmH/NrfG